MSDSDSRDNTHLNILYGIGEKRPVEADTDTSSRSPARKRYALAALPQNSVDAKEAKESINKKEEKLKSLEEHIEAHGGLLAKGWKLEEHIQQTGRNAGTVTLKFKPLEGFVSSNGSSYGSKKEVARAMGLAVDDASGKAQLDRGRSQGTPNATTASAKLSMSAPRSAQAFKKQPTVAAGVSRAAVPSTSVAGAESDAPANMTVAPQYGTPEALLKDVSELAHAVAKARSLKRQLKTAQAEIAELQEELQKEKAAADTQRERVDELTAALAAVQEQQAPG